MCLENEPVFGCVKFALDGSKNNNLFEKKFQTKIDTNVSYIMSYMTCEYKHDEIKPLILNQSVNLEVLDSLEYINSSTTKFRAGWIGKMRIDRKRQITNEHWRHNLSRSYCFQVQPFTCQHLS